MTKRNGKNGRWTYDGDFDRMCKCGETLGNHLSEAPHEGGTDYGMEHRNGLESCPGFRPARRAA